MTRRRSMLAAMAAAAIVTTTVRAQASDELKDLPLVVVPATGAPTGRLAVLMTGDGGWATIDKTISDSLTTHGIAVVGLDSRQYFEKQRTAEGASGDLARVLRHYLATFSTDHVLFVGYSRGADTGPFLISRLPDDLLPRVDVVVLLAPAHNANFKFHLVDLVSNKERKDDLLVAPEIAKLAGRRVLCLYGADEKDSACRLVAPGSVEVVELPGGHHFDKNYGAIATRILSALP